MSGPALRPITTKLTYDLVQATKLPVIGVGGIERAEDALEYLLAGAQAVQVGTATFRDPNAAGVVRDGLREYLRRHEESNIGGVIGTLAGTPK